MRGFLAALIVIIVAASWPSSSPAEPRLDFSDRFQGFRPGYLGYQRDRGVVLSSQTFFNFGVTQTSVAPSLDTAPVGHHYEVPDVKYRVRLNLVRPTGAGAPANPSGTIEVTGQLYEADPDPSLPQPREIFVGEVTEHIPVSTHGTVITSTYFDRVTSIRTTGLGTDVTLQVAWWDGHEQEVGVAVRLTNLSDNECEQDYLVYFNGQSAQPGIDPQTGDCAAGLLPIGTDRGMYLGLDPSSARDAYFHFRPALGHVAPPFTSREWLNEMPPVSRYYFESGPTDDPLIRSAVVELERKSDLQIVDAARLLLPLAETWWGQPLLVPQAPEVENPGAFAQLSPRGLDRLENTHRVTLPYPLRDPGTQPRLSGRAIELAPRPSEAVEVNLADLPDMSYWTKANPNRGVGEFAGYLAYQDIHARASTLHQAFKVALEACNLGPPLAVPICRQSVRISYCVDDPPEESDFKIRVNRAQTYFDPERPLDALVVHELTDMNLSFGDNRILADFRLEDIRGILGATIHPEDVTIEWDAPAGDPCTIKPSPRVLSNFPDSVDYEGWFSCKDLAFRAASGTLASPIPFDLVASDEALDTPFRPFQPQLTLQGLSASAGTGTCGQPWFEEEMKRTILKWEAATADVIEEELMAVPGQDEALNRLLAPYELGIEHVSTPPSGTPPYEVHPLETYALSARIGRTPTDVDDLGSTAADGLYVPYLTRAISTGGQPYREWLCPQLAAQACAGLAGAHPALFTGGDDWNGDPFDVALNVTTAHINQVLWAQARRADLLGSPSSKVRLAVPEDAVTGHAAQLGFQDVIDALGQFRGRFAVAYHLDAVPYTVITDGTAWIPSKLIYIVPNMVVELIAISGDGRERTVAKFLVDIVDRDHRLALKTGGQPRLSASWGNLTILSLTSTFLPGCYAERAPGISCDDRLRAVVGQLLWPEVEEKLLRMIEHIPVLHRFDAGQQSVLPRHVNNTRTILVNQGVNFFADLCDPSLASCR